MTQKEQKKKTLDGILWDLKNEYIKQQQKSNVSFEKWDRNNAVLNDFLLTMKPKQQILELIKSIVPEEKDPFFRKRKDSLKVYCNQMRLGANQAIDEMNKRIKDL